MKLFIGFDGEFSGDFDCGKKHYVISWGFCAMTGDGQLVDKWRVSLDRPTLKHGFEEDCWNNFWLSRLELLRLFESERVQPREGMANICKRLDDYVSEYGAENTYLICDSPADATWLDYYITTYTDHKSLIKFTGSYTGWPYISDDGYRALLGTTDKWGLDGQIDELTGIKVEPGDHDPAEDAREIVTRYVNVLKMQISVRTVINYHRQAKNC